jgi:hypothetical protein
MKRFLLIGIILTFQLAYLEWGIDKHLFIFQAEWEIIQKAKVSPSQVLHPFILLPLFGMLALVVAACQHRPNAWLIISGMASMLLLALFLLFIGVFSKNIKMIGAILPFLFLCGILLRILIKERKNRKNQALN